MKKLIIRWFIYAVALYAAVALLNGRGITPQSDDWVSFIWLALVFGLINAIIKPIMIILGAPVIILTLGLGALLINPFLFYLAGLIGKNFGVGFTVESFWTAILGSLIVGVISIILEGFFKDDLKK
ncbi:MAG: phage holin family protein [Anaerolineaceae bacterium]|nr:phage holin family protein [Anaerolineaceae bacterium]